MRRLSFALIFLPALSFAGDETFAIKFVNQKMQAYEEKLVSCEEIEDRRPSPEKEVMDELRKFDQDDVRRFLVATSSIALHNCTMPEVGDASFILGSILESRVVGEDIKKYVADRQALIHASSWGFYENLNAVPSDMRSGLAEYDYFKKPFDALKILDSLEFL